MITCTGSAAGRLDRLHRGDQVVQRGGQGDLLGAAAVQGDEHMIIVRAGRRPWPPRPAPPTMDTTVLTTTRRGRAPLSGVGLGELAVGDRGEVHPAAVDQVDAGVLGHRGQAGDTRARPRSRCRRGRRRRPRRRRALSRNGSPVTSRTTRAPGCGVLEHDLGPGRRRERLAGLGQAEGGDLGARRPRVIAGWPRISRCRSSSKITAVASARAAMAPRVSRSGSPGPVPTKITRPRVRRASGGGEPWGLGGPRSGCTGRDVVTEVFSRSVQPRR